jgi:prepilin-type N-terminal cleavage/methylation domain-containing protein
VVRYNRRRVRRGFTLLELLVVVGIILALVSLSAVAILKTTSYQQRRNTESAVSKIDQALQRRMKRVIDTAKSETPHQIAQTLANGDPRRAQVIHILMCLKRELPTSFAEARNPVQTVNPLIFPAFAANQAYVRALNGVPGGYTPEQESSACLYLILKQSQRGGDFDPDTGLSSQEVISDSNNVRMILDGWGNPISLIRWPSTKLSNSSTVGLLRTFALNNPPDKEDPEYMLDTNWWLWVQAQPGSTFIPQQAAQVFSVSPGAYPWQLNPGLYPVPNPGASPSQAGQQYQLTPVIFSKGADGTLGTPDDIFNFLLNP